MASRIFLTARWERLLILSYAVPDEVLMPHLPPGLELDRLDGSAVASVVAFDFLDTRVLGVPWPGFRNFPEWNLRFYVKHDARRGVCFVREFVPQRWVAFLARTLYNEPYHASPMSSTHACTDGVLSLEYGLRIGDRWHRLSAKANAAPQETAEAGAEDFFKEHQWGFGTSRRGRLMTYEVRHPRWRVHRVHSVAADFDWEALYGGEWRVMNGVQPISTMLAEGSAISVSFAS